MSVSAQENGNGEGEAGKAPGEPEGAQQDEEAAAYIDPSGHSLAGLPHPVILRAPPVAAAETVLHGEFWDEIALEQEVDAQGGAVELIQGEGQGGASGDRPVPAGKEEPKIPGAEFRRFPGTPQQRRKNPARRRQNC